MVFSREGGKLIMHHGHIHGGTKIKKYLDLVRVGRTGFSGGQWRRTQKSAIKEKL